MDMWKFWGIPSEILHGSRSPIFGAMGPEGLGLQGWAIVARPVWSRLKGGRAILAVVL